jgi:hypothetical protein
MEEVMEKENVSKRFGMPVKNLENLNSRPTGVYGIGGEVITLDDLPLPSTRRWVPRRKAKLVAAVRGGLITPEQVENIYRIGREELQEWATSLASGGLPALCITRELDGRHREAKAQFCNTANEEVEDPPPDVEFGDIVFSRAKASIIGSAGSVHLTIKEEKLLQLLIEHVDRIATRTKILAHVYPDGRDVPEQKIVDAFACNLRKKLARAGSCVRIDHVWGRGYTLIQPET